MKMMKQRNIPWLGALVDSLYTSLPILSIINFLSITVVLYATIKEHLLPWFPWMTLGIWLATLSILVITTMMLIYLFVIPSIWTFRSKQMHKFESAVLDEIRELRKELQELKEKKEVE